MYEHVGPTCTAISELERDREVVSSAYRSIINSNGRAAYSVAIPDDLERP